MTDSRFSPYIKQTYAQKIGRFRDSASHTHYFQREFAHKKKVQDGRYPVGAIASPFCDSHVCYSDSSSPPVRPALALSRLRLYLASLTRSDWARFTKTVGEAISCINPWRLDATYRTGSTYSPQTRSSTFITEATGEVNLIRLFCSPVKYQHPSKPQLLRRSRLKLHT